MSFVILPEGIDLEHLKERLLDEVDKIPDTDLDFLNCFKTMWEEEFSGEFNDEKYPLKDNKPVTLKFMKSFFHDIIIETFESFNENSDVTWINHKGDRIYMSGGMSWGDSPTETYNTYRKFYYLESWKKYDEIVKEEKALTEIEK